MPKDQTVQPDERFYDLHAPLAGVDTSMAFVAQPNKPLPMDGSYARTTVDAQNVRGFDGGTNRSRGGSRPGLVRYVDAIPGDTPWIIQHLAQITLSS